jgi:septum formation topological specificity factor MinE
VTDFRVDIDPEALDLEWLSHPPMVKAACVAAADARHRHTQAKNRLKLVTAQLRKKVRANPTKFDLPDKPTKDMVEDEVVVLAKYQDAVREEAETKYALDMMEAAVTALDHRRTALSNYTDLHWSDYHSAPRSNIREVRDSVERGESNAARTGMDRKKRGKS